MSPEDERREAQRRLREAHQRVFDLQGSAIAGLREAIEAIGKTHDEIALLFKLDNDLDDLTNDAGGA